MGIAQGGKLIGENVAVRGIAPSGIVAKGIVVYEKVIVPTWRLVAITGGGANQTNVLDTTEANLLIVAAAASSTGSPLDLANDTYTNTWQNLRIINANSATGLFYCIDPNVGPGHRANINGTYANNVFAAFSCNRPIVPDQTSINGATTERPGPLTPSEPGTLILSTACGPTSLIGITAGFDVLNNQAYVSGVSMAVALASLTQADVATVDPIWQSQGAVARSSVIISFKPK